MGRIIRILFPFACSHRKREMLVNIDITPQNVNLVKPNLYYETDGMISNYILYGKVTGISYLQSNQ